MVNEVKYEIKFYEKLAKDDTVKIVAYVVRNELVIYGYYVYTFVLEKGLPASYPIEVDESDEQIKAVLLGAIKRFETIALVNTVGKRIARLTIREIDRAEV